MSALLKGRIGRAVLPPIGAGAIRALYHTQRWDWIGREHFDPLAKGGTPFILSFWHGRILMIPPLVRFANTTVNAMISNNRDGELIARTVERFGGIAIRGSSHNNKKDVDKGGGEAFREALKALSEGGLLCMTPDGPRGPRMRAHHGVATISAAARVPVLPFANSVSRGKQLRSWDRFLVAYPFGRAVYAAAPAILPPDDTSEAGIEEHRGRIEAAMISIQHQADEAMGRDPLEPGQEAR